MDSIKIGTGEKKIPIVRDGLEVGVIVVNPSDVLFMERFYKICQDIASKLEGYKEHEIPDGMEAQIAIIHEINDYMRERIDYAFGAGTCQIAFGDMVSYDLGIYTQFVDGVKSYIDPVRVEKVAKYLPQNGNGHKKPRAKPRKR